MTRILVIGATGGTGQQVVRSLRSRGISPRLFIRDLNRARLHFGEAEYIIGDALNSDLAPAFEGVNIVISSLGSAEPNGLRTVDLPATKRLVQAAKAAKIDHFILCSTIGAVPTPGVPDHLIQAFAPKGEAEAALIESGVPFTIIRPGRLFDGPTGEPRGISRQMVGEALVAAALRDDAIGAIYELNCERLSRPGADPVLGINVRS